MHMHVCKCRWRGAWGGPLRRPERCAEDVINAERCDNRLVRYAAI
jgi:hypothetical protein